MKKWSIAVVTFSVLMIMAIISTIQQRNINRRSASERQTRSVLSDILSSSLCFWEENGEYPNNLDELRRWSAHRPLENSVSNQPSPIGIDGWGRPLLLEKHRANGRDVLEIRSSGANSIFGDGDDIVRWFPIDP